MSYLLDTHTFLWFIEGSSNLSKKARSVIENSQNKIYISIASIWEMAIKLSIGRLQLDVDIEDLKQEILKNNFEILPLDFEHIIKLSSLDTIHKDPFDRILISQAIFEGLTIISKDSNFELYKKVKLLW